jgi:hypothetical protein
LARADAEYALCLQTCRDSGKTKKKL